MDVALALFLFLHAVAHVYGFAADFRLLSDVRYKTTLFGGRVDVGVAGTRVVAIAWLLLAIAFAAAGAGLLAGAPWWPRLTLTAALASIALSTADLPAAKLGVVVNLVLLVILFFESWMAWFVSLSIKG